MNAIETKALTKQYKDVAAVKALDLTVKEGELFALLGVNGAGKTTTIKMLSCLTRPTSGDARVCGASITEEAEAVKRQIAVSPQETALAPRLTVRENLEMMAGIGGRTGKQSEDAVRELSALLGLDEVLSRPAGKLSGGWQRRVSIAMALILEPKLLFLDEPTLGLDVIARSGLWDVIRGLTGKMTIILTTHYMEEAEALSDRIGIMGGGRLLRTGTAAELKAAVGADTLETAFIALAKEAAR